MSQPQATDAADAADDRQPFGAFVVDTATRDVLARIAERRGWPAEAVQRGGLRGALRTLGVMAPPRLAIVDVAESAEDEALDGIGEIVRSGTHVIVLGAEDDDQLFRQVLTAGAVDYLVKPSVGERDLERAITRALTLDTDKAGGRRRARCLAVTGARGGTGASTVAAALAWIAAEHYGRRVTLVDLDIVFGTTAFAFDLQPSQGLREAVEDPSRIDDVFLERASQSVSDRLSVLADEEGVDQPPEVVAGAYKAIVEALANARDVVVVDVPRWILQEQPDLLEELDQILIVSNLSLTCLRDTNRLAAGVRRYNEDIRVGVAANRVTGKADVDLGRRDFGKQLTDPLRAALPLDAKAATRAMRSGKPLSQAAPKSRVTRHLVKLCGDLVGAHGGRRGIFARLFRRAA